MSDKVGVGVEEEEEEEDAAVERGRERESKERVKSARKSQRVKVEEGKKEAKRGNSLSAVHAASS